MKARFQARVPESPASRPTTGISHKGKNNPRNSLVLVFQFSPHQVTTLNGDYKQPPAGVRIVIYDRRYIFVGRVFAGLFSRVMSRALRVVIRRFSQGRAPLKTWSWGARLPFLRPPMAQMPDIDMPHYLYNTPYRSLCLVLCFPGVADNPSLSFSKPHGSSQVGSVGVSEVSRVGECRVGSGDIQLSRVGMEVTLIRPDPRKAI